MSVIHVTGRWNFTTAQFLQFALRLTVGFLLMLKGFYFIRNIHELQTMIMESSAPWSTAFMVHYIPWAHMIGGAFIMLGLLTRVAIVLQIPIIIGAIMYNLGANTFGTGFELALTFAVLALLVYFLVVGSGKISMDEYRKTHQL
jgi:putative oxidoreductase